MELNYKIFDSFPEYESERLIFRSLRDGDTENLYHLRSNPAAMKYIDLPMVKSMKDAEDLLNRFRAGFTDKNGIVWAIINKADSRFMGHFSFFHFNPEHCRIEVGYILSPEYWRKGYMTEALNRLIPIAYGDINAHSIEANCNPANEASIKMLEKFGFVREAYFRENYLFNGKFLDSVVLSLLEKDIHR